MIDFTATYKKQRSYIHTALLAILLTIIGKIFIYDSLARSGADLCNVANPPILGQSGFIIAVIFSILPAMLILKFSFKSIGSVLWPILGIFMAVFIFTVGGSLSTEKYSILLPPLKMEEIHTISHIGTGYGIDLYRRGFVIPILSSKVDVSKFLDKNVKIIGKGRCKGYDIEEIKEVN